MKLFLSSLSISENQKDDFIKLVGKPIDEISFTLIENAADPYDDSSKGFVFETRQNLENLGFKLNILDLGKYINKTDELFNLLKDVDVIWVGGGNLYYLRWLMRETGFDKIIHKLINEGVVYGGGSAGAIVVGQTLKYYDIVDDSKLAPTAIYEGLGLTDIILIPHWNAEGIQFKLEEIKKLYEKDDLKVTTIEDGQFISINSI